MRRLLLILFASLFSAASLHSQTYTTQQAIEAVRLKTDPFVKTADSEDYALFPEASGFVENQILVMDYSGNYRKITETIYERHIFKISDQRALDDYSTTSFFNDNLKRAGNKLGHHMGLQIYKLSGDTIDVNLGLLQKNANDEVAIPNLEVGDKMDFVVYSTLTLKNVDCFQPRIEPLTGPYPVLHGYTRVSTVPNVYVNYKPLQGANALSKIDSISDENTIYFDQSYSNLPTAADEPLSMILRSEPSYKMMVCHEQPAAVNGSMQMLDDWSNVTDHVSDPIKSKAVSNYKVENPFYQSSDPFYPGFKKMMKRYYRDVELTDEQYITLAYNYCRYYILIYRASNKYYDPNFHYQNLGNRLFLYLMDRFAGKRGMDYRIAFTNSRYVSDFDDVIMSAELTKYFGYKNDAGEWQYLECPYAFQTQDIMDPADQGGKALAIDYTVVNGYYQAAPPKEIEIVEDRPEDNYYHAEFLVEPDLQNGNTKIEVERKLTGLPKFYTNNYVLSKANYTQDVYESLFLAGREDLLESNQTANKEYSRTKRVYRYQDSELHELMKSMWEEDWDVEIKEYESCEFKNYGVRSAEDTLIVSESFMVKDLTEQVANLITFDFSKVFLESMEFTKEEKVQREYDAYINFPKLISYQYTVVIPEGYDLTGLKSMDASISNETGRTEIKSEVSDSTLVINAVKEFKQTRISRENWPMVVEFLEPFRVLNELQLVFEKKEE